MTLLKTANWETILHPLLCLGSAGDKCFRHNCFVNTLLKNDCSQSPLRKTSIWGRDSIFFLPRLFFCISIYSFRRVTLPLVKSIFLSSFRIYLFVFSRLFVSSCYSEPWDANAFFMRRFRWGKFRADSINKHLAYKYIAFCFMVSAAYTNRSFL